MRVLFISHEATRSGAPIALLQEISYICNYCKDIKPEVLFLRGGELLKEFSDICVIHRAWVNNPRLNKLLCRLGIINLIIKYLFLRKKYDCIYANTVVSFEIADKINKRYAIPLIGHVHEAECLMKRHLTDNLSLGNFDCFLTVSKLAASNLIENYNVPEHKVRIQHPISFWVDKYMRGEITINAYNYKEEGPLIGCFCNGDWFKSTEIIPLFLKSFVDKFPDFRCKLVIIGDQDYLTHYYLEFVLKKMSLSERVIWLGKVANPLDYLINIDVFLLLSREESFSLAAQEAAIMETPIVGFKGATGAEEWIEKGAGLLVPYMDLNEMSESLYSIISNNEFKQNMGRRARAIAEEMYKEDFQMEMIKETIINVCLGIG